jgi:16S rRNA (cytosine1402-N4)-methyltransferase
MNFSDVKHVPILPEVIVQSLIDPFLKLPASAPAHWLVDCTLGGGGHTACFLNAFQSSDTLRKHRILALDQDPEAVQRAEVRFHRERELGHIEFVNRNFADASALIEGRPVLGLLADLGFSSDQLEDRNRGLSFQWDGPLDMRLSPTQQRSCLELLQGVSEFELEKILREYGEERFSKRIAAVLIDRRARGLLPKTTKELVDVVVQATPRHARHGRIHVATRTFQALRIAVNQELEALEGLLRDVVPHVLPGGRVAILSFHSLEDRQVKVQFKSQAGWCPLTKKPIEASADEVKMNPRARSAKLRIAERQVI